MGAEEHGVLASIGYADRRLGIGSFTRSMSKGGLVEPPLLNSRWEWLRGSIPHLTYRASSRGHSLLLRR